MSDHLTREYVQLWKDYGVQTMTLDAGKAKRRTKRSPAPAATAIPAEQAPACSNLEDVKNWIGDCKRCRLHSTRNKIVVGVGDPNADLMFVGEGPGADEDRTGEPFVGRAGKLLTKIIEAMGRSREDVYIANVVKCRPPQNRNPQTDEVEACTPFLKTQIEVIKPKIVVALGLPSAHYLLQNDLAMGRMRGKFHPLSWDPNVKVMPTYHPAYLLRNPPGKKYVWADMKKVMKELSH